MFHQNISLSYVANRQLPIIVCHNHITIMDEGGGGTGGGGRAEVTGV